MSAVRTRASGASRAPTLIEGGIAPDVEPDVDPIAPGRRIEGSPYMIVGPLGKGGMGDVYEVEHVDLGRRAALKVLQMKHLDRPDLMTRMRDEARLGAELRHRNLVEVTDLGVTPCGRPWFVMPILQGRDLRDEIACRGPLPARDAIAVAAQALDGLAVAHAAGVVHRDVKLENLFLQDDGTIKVLDFGVAKITRDGDLGLTSPGAPPGTVRAMSPEQCQGCRVDGRADVYSIGLVLYELLTGRGPFDDLRGDEDALRFAHCTRAPLPPSRLMTSPLPDGLDEVVLRALAKSPHDRFQSAAEMAATLRALRGDTPPRHAARAPRSVRRPRRGVRSRSPWVAAASALAVAFFALGVVLGRVLPPAPTYDRGPGPPSATKL